jgi:hypothetical protein
VTFELVSFHWAKSELSKASRARIVSWRSDPLITATAKWTSSDALRFCGDVFVLCRCARSAAAKATRALLTREVTAVEKRDMPGAEAARRSSANSGQALAKSAKDGLAAREGPSPSGVSGGAHVSWVADARPGPRGANSQLKSTIPPLALLACGSWCCVM